MPIHSLSLKAVFFDADDTLFRIKGGVGAAYAGILHRHGLVVAPEELEKVIWRVFQEWNGEYLNSSQQYRADHKRDFEWWMEFCKRIVAHYGETPRPDELYDELYYFFERAESRELNHAVTDLISHFRDLGYKTGVLTNNDKRIYKLVEELNIDHNFDYILCASDVGYRKPSPHSFEGARKKVGFQSDQMLYIGDNLHDDIYGATKAGWHAAWYNPEQKEPHLEDVKPTVSVRCFSELITKPPKG